MFDLVAIMRDGANLTSYIFSKKFDNHLFFEADITTSYDLI